MIYKSKKCIVRHRPYRGNKRLKLRGVIYLNESWVGKTVKVVDLDKYNDLIKSLSKAQKKIKEINDILRSSQ